MDGARARRHEWPVRCELVIFDCDGVLVDSEAIALDVLREALAEIGAPLTIAQIQRRFLGRSLPAVADDLAREGIAFDATRQRAMKARLRARFEAELRPMPGMAALVDRLAVPCCVASSSATDRLRHSLATAGLLPRFEGRAFSADEVARGKPHPDLFLHAARRMGVEPAACLVVEDSRPGLAAARAAGMRAVAFLGGAHLEADQRAALAAEHPPSAASAAALAPYLPLATDLPLALASPPALTPP